MNVLSFANLPVIVNSVLDPIEHREKALKGISKNDLKFRTLFMAFLGYEGKLFEDYPSSLRYPVGYLYHDNIITSKEAIVEISKHFMADDMEKIKDFRAHLEVYYTQLNIYPPWYSRLYDQRIEAGITPRKLSGPHTPSGLRSGESRWVVYDASREIIYGPRI